MVNDANNSTKHYRFAVTPESWGVSRPNHCDDLDWTHVLDDSIKAGFSGIELGAYDNFPVDPSQLKDVLGIRKLTVVAESLSERLWDRTRTDETVKQARQTCQQLNALGGRYLVLSDKVNDIRSRYAGMTHLAPRLEQPQWRTMMSTIKLIADIAMYDYGIRVVVHPHAGSYIEFEDEVTQTLDDIPYEKVGLCMDVGHFVYAGMDPVAWIRDCIFRLEHIHFKDISHKQLKRCLNSQMIDYQDAGQFEIIKSVGEGDIDFASIRETLDTYDYRGWITLDLNQPEDNRIKPGDRVYASMHHLKQQNY